MSLDVAALVFELNQMTVRQLHSKYREVFREESRSANREFLLRRIAWQVQAVATGGLTERAREQARTLADPAFLRTWAPRNQPAPAARPARGASRRSDRRLPSPGTILRRTFRGRSIEVTIRPDGVEWEGQHYSSLTAAANAITGSHWNGFEFFGLRRKAARA